MGRWLKGNRGTETPTNLIFVDTESTENVHATRKDIKTLRLKLWVAISVRLEGGKATRRVVVRGKTANEFWKFVDARSTVDRCTWIFGHNIGFDLTMLSFWKQLDRGLFTFNRLCRSDKGPDGKPLSSWTGRLCIDKRTTFIVCRSDRKKYKFVDTGNYWPSTIEHIGAQFGLPKLDMPKRDAPDDEWYTYCERDAAIVEAAVVDLMLTWRKEKCGVFQLTAPMLAMTNFRHTCKIRRDDSDSLDIECDPNSPQHVLERASYYGGRIQPFCIGEKTGSLYHLDVNSLYPHVMREGLYPRRFSGVDYGISIEDLRGKLRAYGVIAQVVVSSRYHTYPVRIDTEQYHCNGRYWTVLAGDELRHAVENECIHRIGRVQWYSVAAIFGGWVDYWYARKVACGNASPRDVGGYELSKIILNSLSGKWAQAGRYWIDRPDISCKERWSGWSDQEEIDGPMVSFRGIAGHSQSMSDVGEPPHSFPAISAFITAAAREFMRRMLELCPVNSVYYMATDSLICNRDAFMALARAGMIDAVALGKFKVVETAYTCRINGANDYMFGEKRVVSGLMARAYANEKEKLVADVWEQLPSIVNCGPREEVTIKTVPVKTISPNRKGNIDIHGWWIPYRICDDPDFGDRIPPRPYCSSELDMV